MQTRALLLVTLLGARVALAQTQYHNLDGSRPLRVEDADPTALYALDADLGAFQLEHLSGGTNRYRAEPKLSYGILPFTELEIRLPLVSVEPPRTADTRSTAGIAGLSIGAMHALNLETPAVPALAFGAEASLPVGTLAPAQGSYFIKGLATKTTMLGRFHLNIGGGTYAVRAATSVNDTSCSSPLSGVTIVRTGQSCGPPIIVDVPCTIHPPPASGGNAAVRERCMAPPPSDSTTSSVLAAPRTSGGRWFAGLAFDHAFALSSTLVAADIFAERFIGLYPETNWTTEIGLRHQVTPLVVVNVGGAWQFAGTFHSVSLIAGATYELATPPWLGK